ncbi:MAG TPA: CHASE4 domain-containing protein [Kiritimatiellia bacterium]|nr:CHASE4 domain-containing protein [Kiritimatiellia bacterium]
MTVRQKTLLLIGGVQLVALGLFWWGSSSIIMRRFAGLEQEFTREHIRRVQEAFESQLSRMDTTARDWAWWDDTYRFVKDGNEPYKTSNLTDATLAGIGVNLFAFVDVIGRYIYITEFDSAASKMIPIPADDRGVLDQKRDILDPQDPSGKVKGLLVLPDGVMMVVARHILTSDGEGPSRGQLVMGRWVGAETEREMRLLTHLAVKILPANESTLRVMSGEGDLERDADVAVRVADDAHMEGYVVLHDLAGEPALLLEIRVPRPVYALALQTRDEYLLALLGVTLVLFLVTTGVIGRFVIERLARLGSDVGAIAAAGDSRARLNVTGNDEISSLADDVNQMLASLAESESEVRKAKEDWERTFNAVPDLICIINNEHQIVRLNQAMADRLGVRMEAAVGKKCHEIVHGCDALLNGCPHQMLLGDKREHSVELREVRLNGDFHVTASPVTNARGELLGCVHVARDVTAQRQAERQIQKLNAELEDRVAQRTAQLEAANKELEAFAYSISHDLRAPLRSIDGFSQAVLEDASDVVPEEVMDNLKRVRAAAQRMGRLIDGLLMLSRLTRRELHVEKVDLGGLVRLILQDYQKNEPTRDVSIVVQDGVQAQGDPELLRIVLQNLVDNAWKFTGRQERAMIEFGEDQRDGRRIFFVRDDGAGFDMQYASKLFGAFQRLHAPSEFEGTGLGLATVQRIIHRHGGSVWAEAEVGKGATFYFTL